MIVSKRQQTSKVRHERKRALLTKKRNYALVYQLRQDSQLHELHKVKAV